MRWWVRVVLGAGLVAVAGQMVLSPAVGGAVGRTRSASAPRRSAAQVRAVAAENEYGDVIAAVGGRYVKVTSIMSNPSTDPHTFEASVQVAREVAGARLVVQNGLGYDTFMDRIEVASPSEHRKVIDVQALLGLPATTRNPHVWYMPRTMPAVARAVASTLARIQPAHAAYFRANVTRFEASLGPWRAELARLERRFARAPVAVTEPVADYLVEAAGLDLRTPWVFQADIMNGVDPSPQALVAERQLVADRKVDALVYNEQVTDPVTDSLVALAAQHGVPVVAVYETMPAPGYRYGRWMLAEARALWAALADHRSTRSL